MKIDIFTHIITEKYDQALSKVGSLNPRVRERHSIFPPVLFDLSLRFAGMDRFADVVQVLSMAEPSIEQATDSRKAVDLARIANDELAELVARYPERFAAAVASLPMNNIDAALKEVDRAVNDLKLRGVQIFSSIDDKPLDSPEFLPLYEKMSQYNLPIWIHPARSIDHADYRTEAVSNYNIYFVYVWPHETTVAMVRLSCSGILEKYPNLKFITHHCGGTVPFLASRIADLGSKGRMNGTGKYGQLTREPVDYLKMFYGDTATYGQVSALMCGYDFFGADHILFGTDMPFSVGEPGVSGVRQVISGIDNMAISALAKKKIYGDNARRLLHL
jgi:aminocarboxymuconate-semialdehyde decarboxylase